MALSTNVVMEIVLSNLDLKDLLSCRLVSKFWNKEASSILRRRSQMIRKISEDKEMIELEECLSKSADLPFIGLTIALPWNLRSDLVLQFFKNFGAILRSLCLVTSLKHKQQYMDTFIECRPGLLIFGEGQIATRHSLEWSHLAVENDDKILKSPPVRSFMVFLNDGCLSLDWIVQMLWPRQHTLNELSMYGMQLNHYMWDKFPVFNNLTSLSLYGDVQVGSNWRHLFNGQQGHKFPVLKELHFGINYGDRNQEGIWSDGLFEAPSVTRINFHSYVSAEGIKQFAQSFPNVVELRLHYKCYTDVTEDSNAAIGHGPSEIWNVREFQHLEKLIIWDFMVKWPTHKYISMDSFLTGIPSRICYNMLSTVPLVVEDMNQREREAVFNILRTSPSILQIANLKELIVCVDVDQDLTELCDDRPFMSIVSEFCALQMMGSLQVKFTYDYNLPLSLQYKRKKAVLEAAFRNVEAHRYLEPSSHELTGS